jgi:DNA ligase-1
MENFENEQWSLSKLVGESKNGKTKVWEIRVDKYDSYSEIITTHGYKDQKMSVHKKKIEKGKNIDKSNATTHFTQAIMEAQSKWNKKKDVEKYRMDNGSDNPPSCRESASEICAASSSSTSTQAQLTERSVTPKLPMLAQDFTKHNKKVKYPCFVQPKLDGYRMIFDSTSKSFTTRQGKELVAIKYSGKLYDELCSLPGGYIFDGELYIHGRSFESLGVLRKTKLTQKDKDSLSAIEYHIYDIISEDNFEHRTKFISSLVDKSEVHSYERIKVVETHKVRDEKEIKDFHQKFVSSGFEGTMIRNAQSKYLEKNRSYDLLKYKDFMDAEFEIVGYTKESDTTGEDKNSIIWIVKVQSENGEGENGEVLCNVRPRGDRKQRQDLLAECESNFEKYKGRKLWVKFFDYTSDRSLRFPTTKTDNVNSYIRDEIN